MKQNETTSSAVQCMDVERQEMRKDFYKRIEQLMNDTDDLCKRIYELSENIEDYITGIEENMHMELDEEDENLQEALVHISEAANEIGEGSYSMDCAYEDIN